MMQPIKVLIVEDSRDDAELMVEALREAGFESKWERVETEADFKARLVPELQIILSDFSLPRFTVERALKALKETGLDIPFIVVSGSIGEERAVECLKSGATDYLLKDRMSRLGPAIHRALREAREIMDRKDAERELVLAHEEMRTIFAKSPVVLYRIKIAGDRFVAVAISDNVERLLGVKPAEAHFDWWRGSMHPDDAERVLETVHLGRSTGGFITEYRLRHRDGTYRWIEDSNRVIFDATGRAVEMVGAWRDVTEQRRLEAQLRQAQKLEAIGTLAGGVAHDFNNILAAILGFAELAQRDGAGNALVQEDVEQIILAAQRAKELVQQINTFSRQQEHQRAPIQLRHVVREALKLLRAGTPSTIVFSDELSPKTPVVSANATQIHQIVMNLGANAAHAMRGRAGLLETILEPVEIALEAPAHLKLQPGNYARLTMSDNGHGMDAKVLERIFDPFFTTKPPGEGTGLGLAVVHGIVQSHGGAVDVWSEPGKGTRFELYFPAIPSEASNGGLQDEEIPNGSGEGILLVDDEPSVLTASRLTLMRLGYAVEGVQSPTVAVELLRDRPKAFALVITDLTMPGMTGIEFATQVWGANAKQRIILTTGYAGAITPTAAQTLGFCDLLFKPVSTATLARAVRQALDFTSR